MSDINLDDLNVFQVEEEKIIRIRVVGPRSEVDKVWQFAEKRDARAVQSGPYTDRDMWPMVDPERFLIVLEITVSDA